MVNSGLWTEEEHDRFLYAIRQYPTGPWPAIAEVVGTRSVRQVQTHTQKYYEKIMRRVRGPRKGRRAWARMEHRIEDDILEFCKIMNGPRVAADIARQLAGVTSSPPPSTSTSPPRSASGRAAALPSASSVLRATQTNLIEETKTSSGGAGFVSTNTLEETKSSETRAAASDEYHRVSAMSGELSQLTTMRQAGSAHAFAYQGDAFAEYLDDDGDDENDGFFDLPSLEESLDFFIASLEHDSDMMML